jgi:hypothetical protein
MASRKRTKIRRYGERGSTLFIVAGSLVILLGMGALAIDLASLYVARNESQRAADSAALAGAKVFVESGCVTSGDCTSQEGTATARATQVAGLNLVGGQPVTVQAVTYGGTPHNPQITVQVQSANLSIYFAGAIGVTTSPTVGATATAEAYNPSGAAGGATYCTGCVRPWLIPNCDMNRPSPPNPSSTLCPGFGYLLDPGSNYGVANTIQNCFSGGGVVGEPIDIKLQTSNSPTLYGAVDVDSPGLGNYADYQQAITTCFTGQTACGTRNLTILPQNAATAFATTAGVEDLLHIGGVGILGQDTINSATCPPQITAGSSNPYGTNGLIATSDSIVTAYIFDGPSMTTLIPGVQSVNIVGFAQIFVTQVDPGNNGDVLGVILGVAGCGNNAGACDSSSIKGPTMLPVRLIQGAN